MMRFGYAVRRSVRARNMRVTVALDGSVTYVLPLRASEKDLERFRQKTNIWVLRALERARDMQGRTLFAFSKKEYRAHKEYARVLVHERIRIINTTYQFKIGRVAIKNHRSRWGSCSKKGNLNFNYRIAQLPIELVDYIVAHEVCHLAEFNHSDAFWKLVSRTIPQYKALRQKLKREYIFIS